MLKLNYTLKAFILLFTLVWIFSSCSKSSSYSKVCTEAPSSKTKSVKDPKMYADKKNGKGNLGGSSMYGVNRGSKSYKYKKKNASRHGLLRR